MNPLRLPRSGLVVLGLAAAFWPVWRWYVLRLTDGSDEPRGLFALAAFLVLQARSLRTVRPGGSLLLPCALLAVYAVSYPFLVPLARALLVVAGIGFAWVRGPGAAGRAGLLALSLPVLASLEFYFGFPLRIFAAEVSVRLLGLAGEAVVRDGTALRWAGETILVDAPCSGVRMLWTGGFLALLASAAHRLGVRATIFLGMASAGLVVGANALRATLLFYKESGIVSAPEWTHAGVGVVLFFGCTAAIVSLASRLAPRERSLPATSPPDSPPTWLPKGFAALCAAAAAVPLVAPDSPPTARTAGNTDWPEVFEGRALSPVSLTKAEVRFHRGFPGAVGRFTDGERQLVLRHIHAPTRRLHSSADCFRGSGYTVERQAPRVDAEGRRWTCFLARRGPDQIRIRERITDPRTGDDWGDPSSWYWSALLRRSSGPWWAISVIE